jgi:hypothetical protein
MFMVVLVYSNSVQEPEPAAWTGAVMRPPGRLAAGGFPRLLLAGPDANTCECKKCSNQFLNGVLWKTDNQSLNFFGIISEKL